GGVGGQAGGEAAGGRDRPQVAGPGEDDGPAIGRDGRVLGEADGARGCDGGGAGGRGEGSGGGRRGLGRIRLGVAGGEGQERNGDKTGAGPHGRVPRGMTPERKGAGEIRQRGRSPKGGVGRRGLWRSVAVSRSGPTRRYAGL